MPYTIFIFVARKATLTSSQFKDYYENKHIPLLKELVGPLFPLHHRRQYFARTDRKGFGGPANRDHPNFLLRGTPEGFDFDVVAELTWEDEKTFHGFYKAIYQSDVAAKLALDEERFLDSGSLRSVVVGETTDTSR
ncbi:hypothetical protein K458DRAFT_361962 [Lentithecium fluviatile CBS 122367]|uniref:EthD domain-containing protein n=1 Tax=Lentithecium fluviatile CBS 122367 TaxID=1168545 RepID=A0A6G1JAZ2_9PLEO|nr:hypothetical protein K458DRAFT_361962 [Lentithecium fluviatile CBS 122367]